METAGAEEQPGKQMWERMSDTRRMVAAVLDALPEKGPVSPTFVKGFALMVEGLLCPQEEGR
jgi:hypothetical protein